MQQQLALPGPDGDAGDQVELESGHQSNGDGVELEAPGSCHHAPAYLTYTLPATLDSVRSAFVMRYGAEPATVFEAKPKLIMAGPVPGPET